MPIQDERDAMTLSDETRGRLASVSTATLAGVLHQQGVRSSFLSGIRPVRPGRQMIGVARTLRYLPMREDLIPTYATRTNAQREAVESLQPGEVLMIDARDVPDAGTIGDIYAMRARRLGAVGIVTDGATRDTPALAEMDIPVYHRAAHASTYRRHHMPVDHQVPIACAGVTVIPGDVVVGDDEGVVVIPRAMVDEVAVTAAEQELAEEWGFERVAAGESTDGTFPITPDRRPEFEAWLARRTSEAAT
jgi:5-oxopent-3-ene-1,2,5-tricarboxylate decarboxylase / 2-hydroxyhepta-2,4-diene-1,7-dioate isomerase